MPATAGDRARRSGAQCCHAAREIRQQFCNLNIFEVVLNIFVFGVPYRTPFPVPVRLTLFPTTQTEITIQCIIPFYSLKKRLWGLRLRCDTGAAVVCLLGSWSVTVVLGRGCGLVPLRRTRWERERAISW